ncbi:AraC family transcriptional regulator [Clostridium sediminicola]|uniref:helix-turn-helix domain-containing protein n=1 Tax=Clostridium sediminicola TaxID=3114879 RepID=UPI0031F2408C
MDYVTCMEKSIEFIEENIVKAISLKEVAVVGGFSFYHFHRIFKAMTGECLKEYIRRRRLTQASLDLLYTDQRIIDIAVKYQFGSQEAFTRAFKKVYRKTPAIYRKNKRNLSYYHRNKMDAQRIKMVTEIIEIGYESVFEKELKLVGIEYIEKYNKTTFNKMLTDFVSKKDDIQNTVNPDIIIGICHYNVYDFDPNINKIHYMFCTEVKDFKDIPKDMVTKTLSKKDYLVFLHKASRDKIGDADRYIYGSFLPKSGYELLEGEDLVMFDYKKDNETKLFVPIKSGTGFTNS